MPGDYYEMQAAYSMQRCSNYRFIIIHNNQMHNNIIMHWAINIPLIININNIIHNKFKSLQLIV